jgi:hypothetical protein
MVDPRSHVPYYVGQTPRPLCDRMDEHFFERAETPAAKKNRAIIQSGLLPRDNLADLTPGASSGKLEAQTLSLSGMPWEAMHE